MRANDDADARVRLKTTLNHLRLCIKTEHLQKLEAVCLFPTCLTLKIAGDVSLPRFGISPKRYFELASQVSVVCHSAAMALLLFYVLLILYR